MVSFALNLQIGVYPQGQGDLVRRLIMRIAGPIIWLVGVINRLTMSLQLPGLLVESIISAGS